MIQELLIKNFAIISKTKITFNEGMSVLTGETGAGKSIIIDAIGQLLGQRANASMVKHGEKKALIEAVIDIEGNKKIIALLEDIGIDNEDDHLYVTKEILSNGKSTCKINYRTVPSSILKRIIPLVIDIHSQFDNTKLLDNRYYLDLLDQYAYNDLKDLIRPYQVMFEEFTQLQKRQRELENEEENFEQLDFYQSQLDEINQFDFENEGVDELEKEHDRLKNFEKIQKHVHSFKHYMHSDEGSLPTFYLALKSLQEMSDLEEFENLYNELYDLYYKIEDNTEKVLDTYNALEFDEYRFNEVQNLLFIVQKLKRKYGPSVEMVIEKREEIMNKINFLNNREHVLAKLADQIKISKENCMQLAKKIHAIRKKAAQEISKEITKELHLLYMEHAIFDVQLSEVTLNKNGFDQVEFMITTNLGQSMQPVSKIASGGELSRIMLSLKTILFTKDSISTIIFDEVDTGVSGKVAYAIGQKMMRLSKNIQVLCITHLPQVACFASTHLYVSKYIEDNDTKTKVEYLNEHKRIEEIAKMISGDVISEDAFRQAQTLLEQVASF